MKQFFSRIFLGAVLVTFAQLNVSAQDAQCRWYGGQCEGLLEDFKSNGQMNNAAVSPGESVSLNMVFYAGHDYRLVLCSDEHLGEVEWTVETSKGVILFNNLENDNAQFWDFTMNKTSRFVIRVNIPGEDDEEALDGCIALSVGLKPSIKKGFK